MTNFSTTVQSISPDRLRKEAPASFETGQDLFQRGRVEIGDVTDLSASCVVRGTYPYRVEMILSANALSFRCNCSYATRGTICEHDVAAFLAVQEHLQKEQPRQWKGQLKAVLEKAPQSAPRRSPSHGYLLFFSLQPSSAAYYSSWKISAHQITLSQLTRESRAQVEVMTREELQRYIEEIPHLNLPIKTPFGNFNPDGCLNCPPQVVMLANLLIERNRSYYYSGPLPLADYLTLIASTGCPLFLGSPGQPLGSILRVQSEPAKLQIELDLGEAGLRLRAGLAAGGETFPVDPDEVEVVSAAPLWLLAGQRLFPLDTEGRQGLASDWLASPELVIPGEDVEDFRENFLLPLARQFEVTGELLTRQAVEAEPVRRVYLSDEGGELQAELRFGYGPYEVEVEPGQPAESLIHPPETWSLVSVSRKPEFEKETHTALGAATYGLKRSPNTGPSRFSLRARVHPVDFLLHYVPRLIADGYEIYGEEQLKTARVNRNQPVLAFHVSSGIDWFDVKAVVSFGELEVSLKDLRKILRRKERYVKLADGTIGELPEEWIDRYRHLFAVGEESGEGVRVSSHHLTLIDQLMASADRAEADAEFQRRRERLMNFAGITPQPLPAGFTGELRPYQKAGFDWLHFLQEFEFGGCLADDMGLGKTIQVLAFLQSLKERRTGPEPASLIVVPRSLLVNWQREAARFTPDLKLLEYFDADRIRDLRQFDEYDAIITTYGVMLRDIELLQGYTFHHTILDESQAIKNPLSQSSKAARLLRAQHRLVMTGTPIENSTLELWSQFAYLNPGLLGNLDYFNTEFAAPIEKKSDEAKATFLRKMVFPFILRRTKDQVAPELPPRTERVIFSDMEPAQRKLYNKTRDYYRGLLLGMFEKDGFSTSRMKVLEGLLRLRQISNHPQLLDEKFKGNSGKFDLLLETLDTLQAEHHKALVFSQFVSMLRLLRAEMDERKIPYTYLDGRTRDRQEVVDQFQADPRIPFFLISLKAGGVGLNLTAADYVIHIDPWWNPAVEIQASDRTHRIGQDKPVFVYKLITRDSVEEKILQLQDRKKNLVDQLITTESSFFKALTPADVQGLFS